MSTFLILGGVGFLFLLLAVFIYIRTVSFINSAQEVVGTVIRLESSRSSKGGTTYAPVFQFRTIEGQMIEVRDNMSSNPPMFREGQSVEVLYDPENPQKARIKKWFSLYYLPLFLAGMGLIFSCVGVFLFFVQ